MMNEKKFQVDLENFKKILLNLNIEREKLVKVINDIDRNYQDFQGYNMDGRVNEETIKDYEYGLLQSKGILDLFDTEINNFAKMYNDYLKTKEEIGQSVGDNNGI